MYSRLPPPPIYITLRDKHPLRAHLDFADGVSHALRDVGESVAPRVTAAVIIVGQHQPNLRMSATVLVLTAGSTNRSQREIVCDRKLSITDPAPKYTRHRESMRGSMRLQHKEKAAVGCHLRNDILLSRKMPPAKRSPWCCVRIFAHARAELCALVQLQVCSPASHPGSPPNILGRAMGEDRTERSRRRTCLSQTW